MSRYSSIDDGADHAHAYLGPLQQYQGLVDARKKAEDDLLKAYHDLVEAYRAKCDEAEREKRNACIWEREQACLEREFNRLKTDVVSVAIPLPDVTCLPRYHC